MWYFCTFCHVISFHLIPANTLKGIIYQGFEITVHRRTNNRWLLNLLQMFNLRRVCAFLFLFGVLLPLSLYKDAFYCCWCAAFIRRYVFFFFFSSLLSLWCFANGAAVNANKKRAEYRDTGHSHVRPLLKLAEALNCWNFNLFIYCVFSARFFLLLLFASPFFNRWSGMNARCVQFKINI